MLNQTTVSFPARLPRQLETSVEPQWAQKWTGIRVPLLRHAGCSWVLLYLFMLRHRGAYASCPDWWVRSGRATEVYSMVCSRRLGQGPLRVQASISISVVLAWTFWEAGTDSGRGENTPPVKLEHMPVGSAPHLVFHSHTTMHVVAWNFLLHFVIRYWWNHLLFLTSSS